MSVKTPHALVTGSHGLVGAAVSNFLSEVGWTVTGSDTGFRQEMFGKSWGKGHVIQQLSALPNYKHVMVDVRDRISVGQLFKEGRFDAVVHCAAQPSHELSSVQPGLTWDVNANGTMNMLVAARQYACDSPFIFMSTNKVYGDAVNRIPLVEKDTRFDYELPNDSGVGECFPIDETLKTPYGASKIAADMMVQEFGRYYGMPTTVFRAGCITGVGHGGVEAHGFLSHLIRTAVKGRPYTVIGHKGKQVRDQLDARDLARAIFLAIQKPKPGAVYNIGGGRENSVSILEALTLLERIVGTRIETQYREEARKGDHIVYVTDYSKARATLGWAPSLALQGMIEEMADGTRRDG